MMTVVLIWSLCALLISPPFILGDEAPYKTEALNNGLKTVTSYTLRTNVPSAFRSSRWQSYRTSL